jgi:hypothetical protein
MVEQENIGETDTSQTAESAVKTIPSSNEDDSEIKISPPDVKSPKAKKTRVIEGVVDNSAYSEDESEVTEEDGLLWKARMKVGSLVNNEKVQLCIIVAIMINALIMFSHKSTRLS